MLEWLRCLGRDVGSRILLQLAHVECGVVWKLGGLGGGMIANSLALCAVGVPLIRVQVAAGDAVTRLPVLQFHLLSGVVWQASLGDRGKIWCRIAKGGGTCVPGVRGMGISAAYLQGGSRQRGVAGRAVCDRAKHLLLRLDVRSLLYHKLLLALNALLRHLELRKGGSIKRDLPSRSLLQRRLQKLPLLFNLFLLLFKKRGLLLDLIEC